MENALEGPGAAPAGPEHAVLVVDDEATIREVCRDALEDAGYQVVVAANGCEALGLLQARPVALVLMDLMMPILDGLSACQAMRRDARLRAIPVILMSAAGTLALHRDDVRHCATLTLAKPFDLDYLVSSVQALAA